MVSNFRSQFVIILDKERAALARVRELELALFAQQARVFELKREVDAKRCMRQQVEELSNAQLLQIQTKAIELFEECLEYQNELGEYDAKAFMTYFKEVT